MNSKKCNRCSLELEITEFIRKYGGYGNVCINCQSNVNEVRKSVKARNTADRFLNQALSTIKLRSKKNGIEFDISLQDLVVPLKCPYLNITLTSIVGKGTVLSNMTIDMINKDKGYVKGNVQVISNLASKMKSVATQEELRVFAKNILNKT